jgi:hypothetical protein
MQADGRMYAYSSILSLLAPSLRETWWRLGWLVMDSWEVLVPYVDLRHLVSGCGCEEAGSFQRCGEVLEYWLKCRREVEEVWKQRLRGYKTIRMVNIVA